MNGNRPEMKTIGVNGHAKSVVEEEGLIFGIRRNGNEQRL